MRSKFSFDVTKIHISSIQISYLKGLYKNTYEGEDMIVSKVFLSTN